MKPNTREKNMTGEENGRTGRVISAIREHYIIRSGTAETNAVIRGAVRYQAVENADLPVVGDMVRFISDNDLAVITEILPRKSVISRKCAGVTTEEQPIAANIDYVGIVMGLDGGRNYNIRALERYLTIAWNSGAQPLVILNKADLCDDPDPYKAEAEDNAPGVRVLITSAGNGDGVDDIRHILADMKTLVLIGPSGVGKSALTNRLLETERQSTGETRESDKRGRHTTTASRLFDIPGGGRLIDSPGLKEVQLWGEENGIDSVFEEIAELAKDCRFSDCSHTGEPGCAVQKALNEGTLNEKRYQSYLELQREVRFLETKTSERAKFQERARQKKFGQMIKDMKNKKEVY